MLVNLCLLVAAPARVPRLLDAEATAVHGFRGLRGRRRGKRSVQTSRAQVWISTEIIPEYRTSQVMAADESENEREACWNS